MIRRLLIMTGTCGSCVLRIDMLTFTTEHHEMLHAQMLHQEQKVQEAILGRYHPLPTLLQGVQHHTCQVRPPLTLLTSDITSPHSPLITPNSVLKTERNAVDFTSGNSHVRHEQAQTAKIAEQSILHRYCNSRYLILTPTQLQIWKI
jgi:hypothetical protein